MTYFQARNVQEKVLNILHDNGGELTPPELVAAAELPFDVVEIALNGLEARGKVRVDNSGPFSMPLVHLQ